MYVNLHRMPASTVDVTTPDGVADAYLARPDDGPHPGVLFIMDAYGLRPAIEEMVARIAADGYVVLAPNVFYRAGRAPVLPMPDDLTDPEQRTRFFQSLRPLIDQLTPEAVDADGAAYLDYLEGIARPGPVGITGYCMGARVGWRIATAYPDRVAALAGFHAGGLATDAPDSPHLLADRIRAEVYVAAADQDQGLPPEQQQRLDDALTEAGVTHVCEQYDGAAHGFTMADTAAYNEAATERHWQALLPLLARTLKG